ncbi:MAG: diguanylate cyclase [Alphaproteobacteria bacterium]|nr:diguanylate cyclase [Alphaproteobacteria bacterium]
MTPPSGASNSSDPSDILAERIRALSAEFASSLKGSVEELRRAWTDLARNPGSGGDATGLSLIQDIAHSLAGTGKSLGFPRVSQTAAPIDSLFRLILENKTPLTDEEIDQIDLLISDLERAVDIPGEQVVLEGVHAPYDAGSGHSVFHVLLFGDLDPNSDALSALKDVGYDIIQVEGRTPPLPVAAGEPTVLLASVYEVPDAEKWLKLNQLDEDVPIAAIGDHGGFSERLDAVRKGASDFMVTPLDREDVFARMSAVEERLTGAPLRVVITEDDQTLAQFYQLTLEHAGMHARIVSDPKTLLNELAGMAADIILMDLYLGSCTGLELAQMVRQFPAYTTVPILFLSTESRISLQLEARHLGADDFLVKPLKPSQLVSAVTSRAHRYRDLKKLTDRDSLTGLLNHTNILRALEREISAAARTKTSVVMAMVDIDHFKNVNDTYGHAVGDQVLLRVTHMLRNRLRRVDHVGRYGGEEFAVVMPNTDIETATVILEELRETCAAMVHETEDGSFSVTFSAGVASFPEVKTGADLNGVADTRLYAAKHGGRNRIVTADS